MWNLNSLIAPQWKPDFREGRSLPHCWESSLCGWVSWHGCQCCCPMRVWQKWLTASPSPVASQSPHRPSILSSPACSVLRSSRQSEDSNTVRPKAAERNSSVVSLYPKINASVLPASCLFSPCRTYNGPTKTATPLSWSHAAHHHNKPTAAAPAPYNSEKKNEI